MRRRLFSHEYRWPRPSKRRAAEQALIALAREHGGMYRHRAWYLGRDGNGCGWWPL